MDTTSAFSYVYAKACGILAHSFVGRRTGRLFEVKKLSDLWALLFSTELPLVPESMLASRIEEESRRQFISTFTKLLSYFDSPDPLSQAYLHYFDYNNLKTAVFALRDNERTCPQLTDITPFSFLHFDAWPSLAGITANTPVAWLSEIPRDSSDSLWENRLDKTYFAELWNSISRLPVGQREDPRKLVQEEIIIDNILWALRLRVYYGKEKDDILPLLSYDSAQNDPSQDILAGPAVKCLSYAVDVPAEWAHWEYRFLLNHSQDGELWTLDPSWCEQTALRYLDRFAYRQFRKQPFSVNALACFFKIKQTECSLIRVAAEGIRLRVSDTELQEFTGEWNKC